MLFVLVSGCYKAVKPGVTWEFFLGVDSDDENADELASIFAFFSPILRMGEAAAQSYPQSVLGEQSVPSALY